MQWADRTFYGRGRLFQELLRGLHADPPRSYSLIGPRLIGKTRLLQALATELGQSSGGTTARDNIRAAYVDCAGVGGSNDALTKVMENARTGESRLVALLDGFDALLRDSPNPAQTVAELVALMHKMPVVVANEQPLRDVFADSQAADTLDSLTQLFLGLLDQSAGLRFLESNCEEWPALRGAADDLLSLTGLHPYLLDRLSYALEDAQGRLASGQELTTEHLPLIRMRLAEHGRPLFLSIWENCQAPPPRVNARALMSLLEELAHAETPIDPATNPTSDEQTAELNWLISQAVVVYGSNGYRIASPLVAEFLGGRIGADARGRIWRATRVGADSPFLSSLTKTENALLRYFQANSNAIVSPQELLADVWGRPSASPRRVQEAIRRLRLRLEEAAPPVGVIQNERGRGYRFIPAKQ